MTVALHERTAAAVAAAHLATATAARDAQALALADDRLALTSRRGARRHAYPRPRCSTPSRSSTWSATRRSSGSRRVDPRPRPGRAAAAPPGQARDAQSGRLGQGPHRPADDRGGRAGRPAQARRHDHRADLGQHRPRPGHRRRAQGLSLHLRDGRQAVRRRSSSSCGRTAPRSSCARPTSPPNRPRATTRVAARLARDIPGAFKPDQYWNVENPAAHERTTGPELLGPDRRADHPFRRQRRDRRHDLRRGPRPQGAQPDDPGHRRGPRGQRPVGRHGPAVPDRGGRGGLLPGHLRPADRSTAGSGSATATRSRWRAGSPARRGSCPAARAGPRWSPRARSSAT